jgi:hypothetical protein
MTGLRLSTKDLVVSRGRWSNRSNLSFSPSLSTGAKAGWGICVALLFLDDDRVADVFVEFSLFRCPSQLTNCPERDMRYTCVCTLLNS